MKTKNLVSQLLLLGILLITATSSLAITYNLSLGQYPPCNTSWSVSGSTFTCTGNGRVSLANGDILVANTDITLVANNGFSLNSNTVGSAANNINLQSAYGTIETTGTNTVNGNISASSGQINLSGTAVSGTITTGGNIVLTGGSVGGQVTSTNNAITTNGTNLQGGASARSGMSITGGLIAGDFVMTSNNPITLSGVTMTSGSISGSSTVTVTGSSSLGSPSASITISSNSGAITVTNNSTVYGNLTAPGYSTVNVNNGGAVFGSCQPNSTPANACTPASTLLGSWRMDEAFWNGAVNEVIDSSGNSNHGRARIAAGSTPTATTALVTPAFTSGSQSTCSYGQFDSTSAPVRTFTYVELSGFPALPSSFTFTAWIRSTNASAQHQRILVRDDAQNGWGLSLADGTGEPRLRFFNRNIQNSGAVSGQGRNPSCGVFCLDTNPVITSNAWHFIAATIDTGARVVTLYVYNQSGSLLARTSAAYSGTWQDGSGTAAIGGETLASAEGRQNSFHFLGNIDEMEIYTGALSQNYIESLRARVRTCPVIAPQRYELQVPQSSIACMATPVTVVACADNSAPCTNAFLAAGGTTATLASSAGSLSNTTVTFNNAGVATTTLTHPAAANGTPVTVTLSNEQIPGINPRRCCQGASCSVSNSCTTTFNSAGLAFATSDAPLVAVIPNQVAGQTDPDNTMILRAVRTSTTPETITPACEAQVTGTRTVQLGYECLNPTSCIAGQTLTLNGTPVQANNINAAINYTNVPLYFDANGTASIPLNYSDVGMLRLHARLNVAAAAPNPAVTLTGTSREFVVRPHTLAITDFHPANPGTTNAGGGFVAAGQAFGLQLESRNANGERTPNFGNEVVSERKKVVVEARTLVYPAGGTLPALVQTGYFALVAPAGTLSHDNLRWPEVGSITLEPRLSGLGYLNAGQVAELTSSGTVGRFYPHEFVLATSALSNGCAANESLNYMGQPFSQFAYRIEARAVPIGGLSSVTANYAAPGYSPRATPIYAAEDANNGTNLGARLQVPSVDWANGALDLTTNLAVFSREASPDGPFASLQLGVGLINDPDNRPLAGRNMNAATTGDCAGSNSCNAIALGSPRNMRFGRLRLDDAFGPETVNLPVNFATEYWAGSFWAVSNGDGCTEIPRTAISYPAGNIAVDGNRTVALGGGSTLGNYGSLQPTEVVFTNGNAGHFFTAPSPGTGSFQVNVNLTTMPWLRFDWNQDGNHNNDTALPPANIGFGQYRGHDRIIYWREVLEN